jgi:hypothetical protein
MAADPCAIIFLLRSPVLNALLSSWPAKRDALMPGTCRSRFSCRALSFLLILLAAPMAARSDALEDSARELAGRIVEDLGGRGGATLELRNLSSLPAADAARVEQALRKELQNRGVRGAAGGSVLATVAVTLSENVKGFVWIAQITQGETSRVVLLTLPRPVRNGSPSTAMPVALRAEIFWEGSERILDASVVSAPGGEQRLLLLYPDGLVIRNGSGEFLTKLEMASDQTGTREPSGNLSGDGNSVEVSLAPRSCVVDLTRSALVECRELSGNTPPAPGLPGRGDQVAKLRAECGGDLWLATGSGDDTQPDFVQAFAGDKDAVTAVSNTLNLPGPVLALHDVNGAPAAIAIVKNLRTGNYEAYRLSITCGR